ncbi:RNA-guided endonuclease TnpB family protein [Radiobacillus kanasensis]|uniref:RNA-guided endonuclease TnpB family protein n=1 Tax=Radiobacillus kanasensis TaxID=2844358 RepID=UPI001E53088C|nr:RNA-guided endonuclease TnpB family protein [Radiobacillus kanasensis]UFT98989.1 RNA-guided endonuclease TnpB family protein [Radiobacillus kanasensis]
MNIAKTLSHKITNHSRIFDETVDIYNRALSFMIYVIQEECLDLTELNAKSIVPIVEKLIHRTKSNPFPKYSRFDEEFYKFPSYFRRGCIASAFGKVKSYHSNYRNWEKEEELALSEGKKFKKKPPTLSFQHKEFPVFYKGNMFKRKDEVSAKIKVFHQNDWVWIDITYKEQDLFKRGVWDWKENNPKLVKRGKKYFLHISYEHKVKLTKKDIQEQKVCAVDLGLTNSAVCSVMDAKGTVLARTFINQAKEKDRLYHITNKLRNVQRQSGWISAPNYWRQINGYQTHIVQDTSHHIVQFALHHQCDVIVFEYLDQMKVPKGYWGAKKLRFKLHVWREKGIQNKVEEMAHYVGMRVSRINARNTSALAYDGSGKVKRNKKKDLATFQTGKVYHADLSASYNIGARYFLRDLLKSFSEKERLSIQAKVPELAKRTSQTLSSLISLNRAI